MVVDNSSAFRRDPRCPFGRGRGQRPCHQHPSRNHFQSQLHDHGPHGGGRSASSGGRSGEDGRYLVPIRFGIGTAGHRRAFPPDGSARSGPSMPWQTAAGSTRAAISMHGRSVGMSCRFAGSESEQGYTDEEWKLVNESRKILEIPDLEVEPTCVQGAGDGRPWHRRHALFRAACRSVRGSSLCSSDAPGRRVVA